MHEGIGFIQDLAVVMALAGVVTVLFHRLKQPVVLGYIAAGVIIGPYTPPFQLIHDEQTIKTLGELGVVFLMFSLGLEFSLRKLFKVGATAVVAALSEIVLMLWLGYEIGSAFGWNRWMRCSSARSSPFRRRRSSSRRCPNSDSSEKVLRSSCSAF